jgi:hypothetical protein
MASTVDFEFATGGGIAVEVKDAEFAVAGAATRDFGDTIDQATQSFDAALAGLQKIADSLHAALQSAVTPPDNVTVQFGVNFSVKSGLVLVEGTGGATLNVTMAWKKS